MPEGVVDGLITFTIRITNTGPSTLDQVPLVDHFSGPMVYVGGSPPANLVDNVNQTIGWTDLTTVTNLGGDLQPGQGYVLTTVFSITVQTDNYTLTNRAVVSNAVDILNNSANDADDAVDVIIQPTAIELLYFTGSRQGADVLLAWATAIELDNYGFRLMRSLTNSLDTAEQIGFRAGQGHGTGSGSTYSLTDIDPGADTLYYWLVDVDFDGKETPHGPVIIDSSGVNSGNGRIIFLPLIVKE